MNDRRVVCNEFDLKNNRFSPKMSLICSVNALVFDEKEVGFACKTSLFSMENKFVLHCSAVFSASGKEKHGFYNSIFKVMRVKLFYFLCLYLYMADCLSALRSETPFR